MFCVKFYVLSDEKKNYLTGGDGSVVVELATHNGEGCVIS